MTVADVRLRPHHLLCIQGFRGQGYSSSFIANLARLVDRLNSMPDSQVRIVTGADDVCSACPHLEQGECDRFGSKAMEIDDKLNSRLGLSEGQVTPWSSLVETVRDSIAPENMFEYCGHCSWSDLNYCTDGIAALQANEAGGSGDSASR